MMELNKYQTPLTDELLSSLPEEVRNQLNDCINNIPFVRNLISPNRLYAKDRPRDDKGRIVVDLTNPHILENMDYFRPTALHYEQYGTLTDLKPNANPNSAFGKWIREERKRCWEGYVRESDGEWVTGYMYWYLNYCPIMLSKIRKYKDKNGNIVESKRADRIEAMPEFWEGIYWRFHYIEQASNSGKHCAELAARGKAHPYSEYAYTPEGKKCWKDVKVGDILFGDDGNTTMVTAIPFDDMDDVYRITLKDGRTIMASGNHLWNVYNRSKQKDEVLTTLEIQKDYCRKRKSSPRNKGVEYIYAIPANKGVTFNSQDIPIDAYTMGLILGDGCLRTVKLQNNVYYTSNSEDIEIYRSIVPHQIVKVGNEMQYFIRLPQAKQILQNLGLHMKRSEDKFIPECYKFNSQEIRLALLRGIMDSDGFVDSNGIPIIGVSSKQLANDITFIARSLGFNCLRSIKPGEYKSNGIKIKCLDSYIVRIYTTKRLFNLPRKYSKQSTFPTRYSRSNKDYSTIVNIEYSHREFCKCVTVDNPSHSYLINEFVTTHNSKSYSLASILSHIFVLGENAEAHEKVKGIVTASQKEFLVKDGVLNKFVDMINFCASNTQFPRRRLKSSIQEMTWTMGYKDVETDIEKGTQNTVIGVSSKDDESKIRGKRAAKILVEEMGSFPRLLDMYNNLLPSVQEGDIVFGQLILVGTAGDSQSDFAGAQEILYNPMGYNMYALPNVYDKLNQGKPKFTFFFPGYVNRKGCYNENGVSDVIKALIEILLNRYRVKYNSTDPDTILKTISETPITPAEAILKPGVNMFPVADCTERILQLDSNPSEFDDVYTGELSISIGSEIVFKPTAAQPIRDFPLKNNRNEGAVEIFQMPEIDKNSKRPYSNRYIGGADPIGTDGAETASLGSIFILDLWTDKIVAEYTGRSMFVDDYFEICRRLCLFFNARLNYENNLKGLFSYFSSRNCTYLLTDTLEFLKDKELTKEGWGNKQKGTVATAAINSYGRSLLRNWLLSPVQTIQKVDGKEEEVPIARVFTIRNRALLKELINYNAEGNFDRISAMGMLMLLREDRMILYQGDMSKGKSNKERSNYLGNDPFFSKNYTRH